MPIKILIVTCILCALIAAGMVHLSGRLHSEEREVGIIARSIAFRDHGSVLIGDSRFEFTAPESLSGEATLNAGMKGFTLAEIRPLARILSITSSPKRFVISIGVNDAIGTANFDKERWRADLEGLVRDLSSGGRPVFLVSVIRNTRGGQFGGEFLSGDRIETMNGILANTKGATFIDARRAMDIDQGFLPSQFSTDGVHFSAKGAETMDKELERACD
jgi:lysophospholipase L1-like esterase